MKAIDFINKASEIQKKYKTVYMWGSFGQPLSESFIQQKAKQYPSFYTPERLKHLRGLIGKGVFAFDCIGLIKGLLWGWAGDGSKPRGGAGYAINGVQDVDANMCIRMCKDVSTDFSKIVPGAVVWLDGHIGIYIGDGLVVEATPKWDNGVQISYCSNIKTVQGAKNRKWTSHGKLPWVDYTVEQKPKENPAQDLQEWERAVIETQGSPDAWIMRIKKLMAEEPESLDRWWPTFIENLRK